MWAISLFPVTYAKPALMSNCVWVPQGLSDGRYRNDDRRSDNVETSSWLLPLSDQYFLYRGCSDYY